MAKKNSKSKKFKLHSFQNQAWKALDNPSIREIALVAGIQGGKTSFGCLALRKKVKELSRDYPGCNYLVGADNYKTLSQATIPTFQKVFSNYWGRYVGGDQQIFRLSKRFGGGSIFFRTATHPNSPEGIPDCVFAWIDEAGKCNRLFQVNVLGRVARLQGQVLYTSTPYALNWLWSDVERPSLDGERKDIAFIQFSSAENPSFPREEFERQRNLLDPKTFRRKYMGLHERMEGLVYELTHQNWVDPIRPLPRGTRVFGGVDFGFVEGHEFALSLRAVTPNGDHYCINTFKQAGMDPNAQVSLLMSKKKLFNIEMFFCDPSRPDMIEAINKAGMVATGFHISHPSFKPIVPGVQKHNEFIRSGSYKIFRGCCEGLEDEYETYHWPENSDGAIEREVPVAVNDHLMDTERMLSVATQSIVAKDPLPVVQTRVSPHIDRFDPVKTSNKHGGGSWENY